MGVVHTPRGNLRAPDDTELVRNGAAAMRDLASDVAGAFVLRAGDTMSGDLGIGGGAIRWRGEFLFEDTTGASRVPIVHGAATNGAESALLSQVPSSSREFKENIEPLTDASAFDAIQPVEFDYRPDTEWADDHDKAVRHAGFIAEDVEAAGLGVRKVADGTVIGLRDSELIAVLWCKVQELEGRLAAVEGK